MAAREGDIGSAVWGERSAGLRPLMGAGQSDTGSLDDAFRELTTSDTDRHHA